MRPHPVAAVVAAVALVLADPTVAHADPPAPVDGVWPLDPPPPVVEGFAPPAHRWDAGHRGVDLGGRVGQPVHAAAFGRISFAGTLAGRGVVVVDHGATRTTYEPVAPAVSRGDRVAAGAVIGRLQIVGSHCFPRACLHWGLIEGRHHYLDPLTLVGVRRVRLLAMGSSTAGLAAARSGTVAQPPVLPWSGVGPTVASLPPAPARSGLGWLGWLEPEAPATSSRPWSAGSTRSAPTPGPRGVAAFIRAGARP